MASSADFAEFIFEQLAGAGDIALRKMFGEYAVYCDGKVIAFLCDDQFFLKKTDAGAGLLGPDAEEAPPYPGASMYYLVSDVDNREFLSRLARASCDALPPPKPKSGPRKKKAARRGRGG